MHVSSEQKRRVASVGVGLADIVFFTRTDPTALPAWALIAAFALVAATVYVVVLHLLRLPEWYGVRLGAHARRAAAVTASIACALLALRSVDQLGGRDVIVLIPIAVLSAFYLHYARKAPRRASSSN